MFELDFRKDDDEEAFEALYENGHWEWNEHAGGLIYKSDESLPEVCYVPPPAIVGPIEFKDDVDLIEQQRFRKRFQRKTDEDDVVTIQDVKDIVLFTTPVSVLTASVINVLHAPITERFLRALILFCQYYLQITEEMNRRALELETKICTENSVQIELQYRENLEDLRLLVAKEYCIMILGGEDFKKHHHMGPSKKIRSLSKKDLILFETVVRISIQIVWIALGRKSYNQIEVEVHRMFKSDIFNVVEHNLKINYQGNMTTEERFVLLGHCVRYDKKLNSRSPIMNEVLCHRNIDYRMLGLGLIKYSRINPRFRQLEFVLVAPEILFQKLGVTLGIIGMPRKSFDTMLREIKVSPTTASTGSVRSSTGRFASRTSRMSTSTYKSTTAQVPTKLYPDIVLPENDDEDIWLPDEFLTASLPKISCSEIQRLRWLGRTSRTNTRSKQRQTSKGRRK